MLEAKLKIANSEFGIVDLDEMSDAILGQYIRGALRLVERKRTDALANGDKVYSWENGIELELPPLPEPEGCEDE